MQTLILCIIVPLVIIWLFDELDKPKFNINIYLKDYEFRKF